MHSYEPSSTFVIDKIVNFPVTDDPSSVPSSLIFEDGCTGLPSLRHVTVTEFSAVHVKTTRSPSVTMRSLGTETSRWPTARKSENNSQKNSSSSAPNEKRMLNSSTRRRSLLRSFSSIFSTLQPNSMKLRSRRFLNSGSVSKSRLYTLPRAALTSERGDAFTIRFFPNKIKQPPARKTIVAYVVSRTRDGDNSIRPILIRTVCVVRREIRLRERIK